MSKWYDENGIDIDAYPDKAFKGGIYVRKPKDKEDLKYCQKCKREIKPHNRCIC